MDTILSFTYIWIVVAIITFFYLLIVKNAPYGRHTQKGWGLEVSNRTGWLIMEIPALVGFYVFFFLYFEKWTMPLVIFAALWGLHYIYRALIFPFRIKTKGKKMPLAIALSGLLFNGVNTWIIGAYLALNIQKYVIDWLFSFPFIIGIIVFFIGWIVNQHSDHILLHLRKPGETDYKIPKGGLFKYVSCPNLLGEIIEWTGFAIMTWSLSALAFLCWTCANLIPRAIAHHKWYKDKFEEYPKKRKAIFPFLW
ncbi:MAG: DUF1295 domain-containing protein [Chitinophagales bacterium]